MCNCGAKSKTGQTWTVTYPNGDTEVKPTLAQARVAQAKAPGAKVTATPK